MTVSLRPHLFHRQAKEMDRKKREAHDHAMHAPLYQLGFTSGVGPHVEESGVGLIPGFAYNAPYEDLRVKK